ncbi:T9SS type B sorting domain-containing protein [Gillisia hiemivivida]|uniref:T9SS type B sorting domain-containing protein n=1 Tax=Gillisia hiemivivida TaxID=291190 RepID=A0A5C6ZT29_9FLAO|nr:T9SS type B sorting domain-containing protein [Gillisia hiemivivida]TXD93253.1 T9SS type B sorting domain-containing protein [Gillisia hiemivivida]
MRKGILNFVFILCCTFNLWSQASINDCSGAIKVCGDGALSTNANGVGIQEISGLNSCSSQENNSIWLEIEITKSGTLGFDLIPTRSDINVDYDFFIFGPNATCGNLDFAIRCSTTNPRAAGLTDNHTGMREDEVDTSEGPGELGNSYVKSLNVLPGETYFIVIDRPEGSSPFNLNWTGSSTVGSFPFPEGPDVNSASDLEKCNASGIESFDVYTTQQEITTQNQTSTSYHEDLADAIDNSNPITGLYTSSTPRKTIYARVVNDLTGCYKIVDFDLIINDGPIITPSYDLQLCDLDFNGEENVQLLSLNSEILNGLPNSDFAINYFENISDARSKLDALPNNITTPGQQIFARVEEINNEECYNLSEINLILNTPPQIEDFNIAQAQVNANSNTISLNLGNSEGYEYSLNTIAGPYQTSTIFQNVESGFVTLYIRDKKQCAIISTSIAVLGYDNFFTPNNDGINDLWLIKGINKLTEGNDYISIFDRYGKLLKQLGGNEIGWDGTSNGYDLPSDDYWFKATLRNGQEFSGHFSLIR